MFRNTHIAIVSVLLVILSACGGGNSPSDAPANVAVFGGDTRAVVAFDQGDLNYWIFHANADVITRKDYANFPEAAILTPAISPQRINGLTNGKTYSFIMNATKGNGPAGPTTNSQATTPQAGGNNWKAGTDTGTAVTTNLNAVVAGLDKFIAVGDGGKILLGKEKLSVAAGVLNSVIEWTGVDSKTTDHLNAASYDATNLRFVTVGANGVAATSVDGSTWTAGNVDATNRPQINGVAFGNSTHVAVGNGGVIYASSDGASWGTRSSNTAQTLNNIAFVNGRFIAVGASGTILTSTDAVTWASHTTGTSELRGVAFGEATYFIVGDGGTLLSSTDAATWTPQTSFTTQNLRDIYFGSRFTAVGAGGAIFNSTPVVNALPTWAAPTGTSLGSDELRSVRFSKGVYVAAGANGAKGSSL